MISYGPLTEGILWISSFLGRDAFGGHRSLLVYTLRSYGPTSCFFFFFGRRPLRLRSPRVRLHTGTRFTHGLLDPPGLQLSTPRLGLGEPRAADDYRPVSRTRSGEVRGGV